MVQSVSKPGMPSQAEFHEVIENGADRWYAACFRITRNRDLAEDAVQEALLSAWNKRHQFQRGARLDTWIYRIAVNAALQILRKNRTARWEPLEVDLVDQRPTPDHERAGQELAAELDDALLGLSEIERICFVLKHLEQWRLREIADELETSVDTIKQAVFRGVKKLRVSMADLRSAS